MDLARLGRLVLLMCETDFASQVIEEHILTNWISNHQGPQYCAISSSTLGGDDAEDLNVLKSVLTLHMPVGHPRVGCNLGMGHKNRVQGMKCGCRLSPAGSAVALPTVLTYWP